MKYTFKIDYPNRKVYAYGISSRGTKYEGIAKCAPEDKFDDKKGKRIAKLIVELRQIQKINQGYNKLIDEQYKVLNREQQKLESTIQKRNRIMDKSTEIIHKLKEEGVS